MRRLSVLFAVGALASACVATHARPADKWAQASPDRQEFFKGAVMPGLPPSQKPESCCGEADAYEADDFDTEQGSLFAILTCNDPENCPAERDDGDGGTTPSLPEGKRILIPADRILPPPPAGIVNRTGHGWVFISTSGKVWCYSPPSGV
jgi:hypothetical protein